MRDDAKKRSKAAIGARDKVREAELKEVDLQVGEKIILEILRFRHLGSNDCQGGDQLDEPGEREKKIRSIQVHYQGI